MLSEKSLFASLFNKPSRSKTDEIIKEGSIKTYSTNIHGHQKKFEASKKQESELVGIVHSKMPEDYYAGINKPDTNIDVPKLLLIFKAVGTALTGDSNFKVLFDSGDPVAKEIFTKIKSPSLSWPLFSVFFLSLLDKESLSTLLTNKSSLSFISRLQDKYKGTALNLIDLDKATSVEDILAYSYLTTKNSKRYFKDFFKPGFKDSNGVLEGIKEQISSTSSPLSGKYLDAAAVSIYYNFIGMFGGPNTLPFYQLNWNKVRTLDSSKGMMSGSILSPSAVTLSKDYASTLENMSSLTKGLLGKNARTQIDFAALKLKRLTRKGALDIEKAKEAQGALRQASPTLDLYATQLFDALDNFIENKTDVKDLKSSIDYCISHIKEEKAKIDSEVSKVPSGAEKISELISSFILPYSEITDTEFAALKQFISNISGSSSVEIEKTYNQGMPSEETRTLSKDIPNLTTSSANELFEEYKKLLELFGKDKNSKKFDLVNNLLTTSKYGEYINKLQNLLSIISPKILTHTVDLDKIHHIQKVVANNSISLKKELEELPQRRKDEEGIKGTKRKRIIEKIFNLVKNDPLVLDGHEVEISLQDIERSFNTLLSLVKNTKRLEGIRTERTAANKKFQSIKNIESSSKDIYLNIKNALKTLPEEIKTALANKDQFHSLSEEQVNELKEKIQDIAADNVLNLFMTSEAYNVDEESTGEVLDSRFVNSVLSLIREGELIGKTTLEIIPNVFSSEVVTQEAIRFINLAAAIKSFDLNGGTLSKLQIDLGDKIDIGFIGEIFTGSKLPDSLKINPPAAMCLQHFILSKLKLAASEASLLFKVDGGILSGWAESEPRIARAGKMLTDKIESGISGLDAALEKLKKSIELSIRQNKGIQILNANTEESELISYDKHSTNGPAFINMIGLRILQQLASGGDFVSFDLGSRKLLTELIYIGNKSVSEALISRFKAAALCLIDSLNYQVALDSIQIPATEEVENILSMAREKDIQVSSLNVAKEASTNEVHSMLQKLFYDEVAKLKEQYSHIITGINDTGLQIKESNLENPFLIAFNSELSDQIEDIKFSEQIKEYAVLLKDLNLYGNTKFADIKDLVKEFGIVLEGIYSTKTANKKEKEEEYSEPDKEQLSSFVKIYSSGAGIKTKPVISTKSRLEKIKGYKEGPLGRNKKPYETYQNIIKFTEVLKKAVISIGYSEERETSHASSILGVIDRLSSLNPEIASDSEEALKILSSNFIKLEEIMSLIDKEDGAILNREAQTKILATLAEIKIPENNLKAETSLPSIYDILTGKYVALNKLEEDKISLPGANEFVSLLAKDMLPVEIFAGAAKILKDNSSDIFKKEQGAIVPGEKKLNKKEIETHREQIIAAVNSKIPSAEAKITSLSGDEISKLSPQELGELLSPLATALQNPKLFDSSAEAAVSRIKDVKTIMAIKSAIDSNQVKNLLLQKPINQYSILYTKLVALQKKLSPSIAETIETALAYVVNEPVHINITENRDENPILMEFAGRLLHSGYSSSDGAVLLKNGSPVSVEELSSAYNRLIPYIFTVPGKYSEILSTVKKALSLHADFVFVVNNENKKIAMNIIDFDSISSLVIAFKDKFLNK